MEINIPYYEDLTRISNSNIGWFLQKGPAYLHKMLTDPPPEEKNPVLERGTMIHMYILQPEEFKKTYVVWDKSRPTSAQQEKFCQALANTLEIEPNKAVLSAYKEAYSTAGKSEDKMLSEGLKIASTLKDYIDFLKENSGRIMISPWDYQMLKKIKYEIEAHKLAKSIINPKNEYTWHEFHINWEYPVIYDTDIGQHETEYNKHVIKCKSLLDGLTINIDNKIVTIYDLKTTQKLWHFEDSIDQYDYLRQLMYYTMAVKWYLKNELNEDPEDYEFRYYIIGIDTTGLNEIRVFEIEPYMVQSRESVIHNAIIDIGWHQMNNKWDHSREYYEGDGSETLNL
jgi:hypothetical protein